MTRPLPITTLDAMLKDCLRLCAEASADIASFLDEHIDVIDAYERLLRARSDHFRDASLTLDAIRNLGYSPPEDVDLQAPDVTADERAARDRRTKSVDDALDETVGL